MKQSAPLWLVVVVQVIAWAVTHWQQDRQIKDLQDASYVQQKELDVTALYVRHAITIADGKADCPCAELQKARENGVIAPKGAPPLPKPDPNPRPRPPHVKGEP